MNRDARTWAGRMILLSALTPALGAWATSFVVNTTADSGPGSLRAAINAANSNSLPAVITFDIPGTGTQTIALQTPLASLAVPVTIDAATQPGYAGTPLVDIDGTALTNGSGLDVFASSVVISGLGIVNCTNGWGVIGSSCSGLVISNCSCRNDGFSGIELSSCSSSVIYGCNVSSNGESGIVVDGGASNTVQNCVVSGNTAGAFALELFTCTSSTVLGCNVSGNDNGMFIYGGASNTVQNCVVGGNSGSGVFLENESGSSINSNWFGVDASGEKLVTPQEESISIFGCLGVVVGGNVFAGDYLGTLVYSSTNSLITNNTFGFLADGITPGDNPTGVQIESGSVNTWVSTCAFGLCHFSGIAVGFSGELAPHPQGTWVSSCVFGADAATGFPCLNHEFHGGPNPTNALAGPGCTAPAIQDHDGINTICVDNLCYNNSATCFEAAPGVNTTFNACLCVGASSGICISAADGVPAPVITQVLSSGSSLTPTISLAGAQPNAVYTCWLGYNTNGDNEMLHYIGAMTVPTDSTGAGLTTETFAVSVPTGATVYAYALAPGGGTSLRSAGLAPGACPPIQLQLTMVDDGAVGNTNFQFNVTASGGTPPYTFMLLGSIPIPGVSLSGVSNNTAIYRGPPTQAGTFPIVISATDSNGCQGLQTYSITINPAIVLTPQQLGTGTIGLPYNQTIYVLGGSPPYSFSAGSFPGVSLVTNSDGNAAGYCVLSGIPTSAGNFPITVSVTDSNADSATEHYTNLTVLFPPQLQLIQVDGGIGVWWPGAPAAGPFILQSTPQLSNAVWTDVLTTFASPIQLPMTGSNAFFRVLLPVIPLDLTDYNKDRPAVAQYYSQDPQTYWAQFGLPSLSRLGNLQISLGGNPTNAFGGVLTAFDPLKFGNALQAGLLPLDFSNVVYSSIQSGNGTNLGVVNGFCSLVSNLDSFIVNS
ncbi:MAG TPA: right-handed parallel beta-helix repeat-containing protein, partial [Candidatus Acidoferrum sp.]|nr:right-handed parallel beta-helix repeat-containing protein [Candidatus Acidoferrum sp.]